MNKKMYLFLTMVLFVLLLQSCQLVIIPEVEIDPESELLPIEEEALLRDENYDRFFDEINHKKLVIIISD
jgi:hypothetical protein